MRHSKYFQSVTLDEDTIPQSLLNIENKTRSNPLKWNGQFSPQLIEVILKQYAESDFTIFDPFLGSGTVLLEAGFLGHKALGTEVNPAAYLLAKTYSLINLPISDRKRKIDRVSQLLDKRFGVELLNRYLSQANTDSELIKTKLSEALQEAFLDIDVLLLNVLIVLLDFHKKGLDEEKVFRTWNRLQQHVMDLPYSEAVVDAFHADARSTSIDADSVDLVITSPPYINVFNYHQQYRSSLEYLDYNLLTIAKSEIGSNRKHRSNRFLTVIQYCLDIAMVITELLRVCRQESRMIFIVGRESTIRGTPFFNGEIVTEIAHKVFDIELKTRQERCFKNRFGQDIYEDILHFSCGNKVVRDNICARKAREVAESVLQMAFDNAAHEVREDILAALQKINEIDPSPLIDAAQVKDYA